MPLLELAFRVAACTQLAFLAVILLKQRGDDRSYRSAAVLFLGIACYLLAPIALGEWRSALAIYPILLMATMIPVFFWYFCNTVFHDGFVPHTGIKWLAGLFAIATILAFCGRTESTLSCHRFVPGYLHLIVQAAKLLWIIAGFAALIRNWRVDLVEPRRRLRRLVVFGCGCYILAVLLVELFIDGQALAALELLNASLILAIVTALCAHMLAPNSGNVFSQIAEVQVPVNTPTSRLAEQVVVLMETERTYAGEGLTIDSLARQLATQPYQLRQVINGELGYRNFNAFINLYRVREVARRLNQDEYRDTPLLTLALDAGFRSMAPFNRSFKEHFNVTPSDYRSSAENNNPI